jgi:hypothetical protein
VLQAGEVSVLNLQELHAAHTTVKSATAKE